MHCKKIQELLKTDYLDGEVDQKGQQYINEHLAQCPDCYRLEKELLTQHMLLQKAKRQQVPERLWQSIRGTIVNQRLKQESSVSRGILQRLRELVLAPRPAFALASALTAVVFVVVLAGAIIQKRQSFSKENGGEIVADYRLNGESEDLLYDLGTNVEEYFL